VQTGQPVDRNGCAYGNALDGLLVVETRCFRYGGPGAWTDYAREVCRRGMEVLAYDFRAALA
jgi:hypothetical protein